MLKYVGAEGSISNPMSLIKKGKENLQGFFQIVSPSCVFGKLHIDCAITHLMRRKENDTMRARDPGVELMMCLSATNQITLALEKCGVKEGDDALIIFWDGAQTKEEVLDLLTLKENSSLIGSDGKDPSMFDISEDAPDLECWIVEKVNLAQL